MARPDILRQVRRFCLDCQGNSSPEIQQCRDTACHLWPWRLGKNTPEIQSPVHEQTLPSPTDDTCASQSNGDAMAVTLLQKKALRVVRTHCLSCAGHRSDVRQCTAREACPLWSLRFGVYPATYKKVKARLARGKRLSLFEE